MATRRCSLCGINYPSNTTCEVCGGACHYIQNDDPDENWREIVTYRRREQHAAALVAEPTPNLLGEQPIVEEHGEFWIADAALRTAKMTPPQDRRMFLFWANGSYWEAVAYDNPRRRWQVIEVDLDLPNGPDGQCYIPEEWFHDTAGA